MSNWLEVSDTHRVMSRSPLTKYYQKIQASREQAKLTICNLSISSIPKQSNWRSWQSNVEVGHKNAHHDTTTPESKITRKLLREWMKQNHIRIPVRLTSNAKQNGEVSRSPICHSSPLPVGCSINWLIRWTDVVRESSRGAPALFLLLEVKLPSTYISGDG